MFQALFATMNEVLEEISEQYPGAQSHRKHELLEQLESLKMMSDICIEEWLQFEEHMGVVHSQLQQQMEDEISALGPTESSEYYLSEEQFGQFERGLGYYELAMYNQAQNEFDQLIAHNPDFIPARIYLAFCYFIVEDFAEASKHFKLITSTEKNRELLAVSYYALAWIHVIWDDHEAAEQYFELARKADPSINFYSLS